MGLKVSQQNIGLNEYTYLVLSVSKSEILIQLHIQISSIFLTGFCQLYCFINLKYKYLHICPSIFQHTLDLYNSETGFILFWAKRFSIWSDYVELIPHNNIYQIHFCYIYIWTPLKNSDFQKIWKSTDLKKTFNWQR